MLVVLSLMSTVTRSSRSTVQLFDTTLHLAGPVAGTAAP
jgi:hypothetical protein